MAEVDAGAVAPVVAPVGAEPTIQPDPTAGQGEGETPEPSKPEKLLTQEEVNKIVQREKGKERTRVERIARAEAERDHYKRQLEERDRQPDQPAGKPKEADFAGKPYEDYVRAVARWEAKEELAQLRQETEARERERAVNASDADLASRLREGAAKYPDFREVAGAEDVPIRPAMKAAIATVKNPADVAYYLGSNIEEAQQIAASSDIEQVWAIKEISAKLSTSAPTKAPAPIKPNSGSGSALTGYRKDMTDKQFAEWRRRSKAQR